MRILTTIVVLLVLSGCSSFKTVKLDSDGTIGPQQKGGIPVVLTKPEFSVKKVEGSDPDQYQVSVSYVPDPTQRYAVRLASTPLAQIDLSLALSESGSLTSTSADVKDQVAPTVLALFKVAASVAVTAGTGGVLLLEKAQSLPDCFQVLDGIQTAKRGQCVLLVLAKDPASPCAKNGKIIADRLQPYVGENDVDKGTPMSTLFAADSTEGECFFAASAAIEDLVTGTASEDDAIQKPARQVQQFTEAFDAANRAPAQPDPSIPFTATSSAVRDAIIKRVSDAMTAGDVAAMKTIFYSAAVVKPEDLAALDRFKSVLGGNVTPTPADAVRLVAVMKGERLAPKTPDVSGLNNVEQVGYVRAEKKGFDKALDLSPAAWKARYMTALQKRAAALEQAALQGSIAADPEHDADVIAVRRDMATLAGARDEFERLQQFDALLDRMPSESTGEHISPAGEYDSLSKQAAALEAAVNSAIAGVLTGDGKDKPPAQLPLRTPWVSAGCITDSASERWRYTTGVDAPEFVVILRRADGTTLEPTAKEKTLCGASQD